MELNYPALLKTQAYVNGQWVDAQNKEVFKVHNPYNGELVAEVADLSSSDVDDAIKAADAAFKVWKGFTANKRARILKKWYALQMAHVDDLGKILTIEQGKPLAEAKGEIKYGASFVEWFAEEARRAYGDTIPGHARGMRIITVKQPVGVVGAITPWNFPSAMITRKVAPALAAGCTVVIKPSELTPLSALALAQLAIEAGFPPGVINIVTSTSAPEVGQLLCTHPKVRKISFTGSTRVGKILLKQAADGVKKVSMELGGNAPFIVFDDADIDEAVKGAIGSKFRNAGQTCICANRFFVQDSIYDEFAQKFAEAVKQQNIGDGMSDGTVVGPMIQSKALDFVESLVEDAQAKGAEILTGGKRRKDKGELFFDPTVLTGAEKNMNVFDNEIFGPVAPLFRFKTEEEVIALANDTNYGLASYFYGRDYARIWRVAEALEYGMVGINTGMISTTVAPFGGVKESGFGREGSKYGMDDYLEVKYMCWGGID